MYNVYVYVLHMPKIEIEYNDIGSHEIFNSVTKMLWPL